ncbi:MAG TPA: molybdopterin-synthase adenylyltransferase MoeB [Thermomicrobiales bacterium]|nr:molybdopterin-synthase adenylyltransferase MoeB [Thermomicrobiales bacterium]
MPTYQDLLASARATVPEPDVNTVQRDLETSPTTLIDIREQDEVDQGMVSGAIHIPRGYLELRVEQAVPDKDAPVVLYCAGGTRSLLAARALQELGYTNVSSLEGGFNAWKSAGAPWSTPRSLTSEQRRRYSRHLLLPDVGEAGQTALLDSRVLLIGAGGLGSPAALYLAAAGVGTLGVIDDDVVDASNLQRQVIHTTDRIGEPKVESARVAMEALNPDVTVHAINDRLTRENIFDVIDGYDVIVDGSDNFATRYLLNDAAVLRQKPVVHGSIFRFDGQVTVLDPRDDGSPCYRCLFASPPPPELAPNCAEAGVLGVLPGMIGMIQATETIKLLLGIGEPLTGRLLMYDARSMDFRTLRVKRSPTCPMCGEGAPTSLDGITYDDISCAIPASVPAASVAD